jgi:glutaredoxin
VNVYFFWGEGCPHCAKEKELLDYYTHKYPFIQVLDFELYNNYSNAQILSEVATILNTRVDGVPFTVIGDQTFSGYSKNVSPDKIYERIEYCHVHKCQDSLVKLFQIEPTKEIIKTEANSIDPKLTEQVSETIVVENIKEDDKMMINVPLLGKIDVVNFSLPLITIVMGVLDGFNPCALWTLLFLISLLLGMENKKRMWVLGSAFIVASASVYFLFMAAWLNFILFIGFVIWIRLLIGGVALFGGTYNLKEFFFNKDSGCKVTNDEKRQKVFARLKQIVQQKSFVISFLGIMLLAFAVNLVELICSAGLPAVYTQILALNNLNSWQYYTYILFYIFFFMIDDLIIFFVAMTTLQMTGISTKYSRMSKLIGGSIMVIIGLLLILKPEWLMFG